MSIIDLDNYMSQGLVSSSVQIPYTRDMRYTDTAKNGTACNQTRALLYVQMRHTICPAAAYLCGYDKLNRSMQRFVRQLVKTGRGIQKMTSGAGVSRTIWRDFRLSRQPEVLLEFITIKLQFFDQIIVRCLFMSCTHPAAVFSLVITHTHTHTPNTHTHARTHTCFFLLFFTICITVVLSCSQHERLKKAWERVVIWNHTNRIRHA